MRIRSFVCLVAAGVAAVALACGDHNLGHFDGDDASIDVNIDALGDAGCVFCDGSTGPAFGVQPAAEQDITVTCGQAGAPIQFNATATDGSALDVTWSTDQAGIGSVSPTTGSSTTFTATGAIGGLVTVLATYQQSTVARQVLVKLTCNENGGCPPSQIATTTTQLTQGGGVGGVGGEGCGTAVDSATATALASPSGSGAAQSLKFVYPYDHTVWPRGLLAPSLQWSWTTGDADAIKIDLSTTSGSFTWSGTFTRPAILQSSGKFTRHPIPEDVWEMATNTAGASIHNQTDQLTVNVTLASGGKGYGPISETWTIAPARMKGTIYYQSYGTKYATSSWGMGAATLAIKHGATAPALITSSTRCQACHSVAANGSMEVTDDSPSGDYGWTYDLSGKADAGAPAQMPGPADQYIWGAISPDGTTVFSNSAPKWGSPNYGMEGAAQTVSQLFALPGGGAISTPSLPKTLGASMPVFSPDGKHIAFNFYTGGPGTDGKSADQHSLAVIDFDAKTKAFSNLHTLDTPIVSTTCPNCTDVWPSYMPTSDSIVFQRQIVSDSYELGGDASNAHYLGTYSDSQEGARSSLWWIDVATQTAHPLDALNGVGYLPSGGYEHVDDSTLAYQPTVAPLASGGYVWVVFTSRRLYGNIATINPWDSNTQDGSKGLWETQPMTKKLWVAAIDLNAPPGTDPSHAAFYLPAQELMAGNSRGYWVLDPCEPNGSSCESGDECCGGHCVAETDGGVTLVCGNGGSCGGEGDTCAGSGDCCSGLQCVGGHCDVVPVK